MHLLNQIIERNATLYKDKVAYSFIENKATTHDITYLDIFIRVKAIAANLQQRLKPGDRVALLYMPGNDFICAFLACLYAGIVAVPCPIPTNKHSVEKLRSIIADAKPSYILADKTTHDILHKLFYLNWISRIPWLINYAAKKIHFDKELIDWGIKGLPILVTSEIKNKDEEGYKESLVEPESLAFLQYTSGSTGYSKGVMITHQNIMHNEKLISEWLKLTPDAIAVSWLPHFHDMGLIGLLLGSFCAGGTLAHMSPITFIKRPSYWVELISKYRAQIIVGPSFSFNFCADKVNPSEIDNLDLSSVRHVLCGSEYIHGAHLRNFYNKFKDNGLRSDVLCPCYGLAESTLLVTGVTNYDMNSDPQHYTLKNYRAKKTSSCDKHAIELIPSGYCLQDVAIVNPKTRIRCKDGEIGEVWVSGQSVAKGYWNKPELTQDMFCGKLQNDSRAYLRTGDLGFINNDHIYIVGRIKDLIIICGANYYPDEIESVISHAHTEIKAGQCAAFSLLENNEEHLAVVVAVKNKKESYEDIVNKIQSNILDQFKIEPHEISLVDKLPKTSSGKIMRYKTKEMLLQHELNEYYHWEK